MSFTWKIVIVLIGAVLPLSVQAKDPKFPDWLGGKPDVVMHADRCVLYDWFFKEANRQTDGKASKDDLAAKRVINIANKLTDHHRTARLKEYTGVVKYLVFGETQPYHFSFQISSEQLERILNEECRE
jgi:hypothetical protein